MIKARIAALGALVLVTACEGLKEAMTAHVDVAARAEKQELSVQRLADMIAGSQIAIAKPVFEQVADVWVNYQLLAKAASVGDSMTDTVLIDKVMKDAYSRSTIGKWMQIVQQGWTIDTSNLEAAYNDSKDYLSAKHILFSFPQGQEATGSDSVMKRAESIRRQVNERNFATLAKQHSGDPSNKDAGGELGVFPAAQMVAEFSRAVAALKPGEIGPLVRTQYGYHIVRRNTFAEARQQFAMVYANSLQQTAQSTFVDGLMKSGKVEVKPNAGKTFKDVAADLDAHTTDRAVLATSLAGSYTAADLARMIRGTPQRENIRREVASATDSQLVTFVKNLVVGQLLERQADSAGIKPDTAEKNAVRNAFKGLIRNSWAGLRISPELLADSAKTPAEKERLAASRVDAYMDRLIQGQEGFIDVPPPLAEALREKYNASIKAAGLTRAVELATKTRAAADSTKAVTQPKSAVPMPPDTSANKR
jgi:parvulin-like peptidyl-prolyl isomerase